MKSYNSIYIYYFSGTGNAKHIAEEIIDYSIKKGLKAELFDIGSVDNNIIEIPNNSLIGFIYPTHGFNAPPIVLKFLLKIKKKQSENVSVFFINTRAGMKIHKLFTPGLSGIALILPAIFLFLKRYKVVGLKSIDMPSNWISLHPGLRLKVVKSITERCEKISIKFIKNILSGKKSYRPLFGLPVDLLITPISVLYYLIGRFALAKTFISTDICNNCGLCIKKCPVNAIIEAKGVNYWTFSCESCMKCMNTCPKRAIETAHGFTFLLWWGAFSVLSGYLANLFFETGFYKNYFGAISNNIAYYLIQTTVGILSIYIGYKILNYLMRFKIFNKIVAYTSLTKYKFWRRYLFRKV